MDLASVVAALASVGVRVSGSAPNSSVQVDSSRACPPGLAGPEPSGTINDLGQHFHGHGKALFSGVSEAIGILRRCGNQGKAKEKSLFSENATVVATTAQGGSKKKCFSNALGYTLVVLEVL